MNGPAPQVDGPTPHDGEPVGSIAEEAFKLFRAVAPGAGDGAPSGEHVCSTTWCPVCQLVGFVQQHPDAIASVTQSAAGLVRSLRDLVDTALAPQPQEDQ